MKKRTDELDWDDVQIFLALARHESLSAAARTLGVNHATIGRRIDSLERRVGGALFERGARGYAPTPLARTLEWLRMPGDLVFMFLGALPLALATVWGYLSMWRKPAMPDSPVQNS